MAAGVCGTRPGGIAIFGNHPPVITGEANPRRHPITQFAPRPGGRAPACSLGERQVARAQSLHLPYLETPPVATHGITAEANPRARARNQAAAELGIAGRPLVRTERNQRGCCPPPPHVLKSTRQPAPGVQRADPRIRVNIDLDPRNPSTPRTQICHATAAAAHLATRRTPLDAHKT